MITVTAPGKIHFLGEHTAVYGKPAILAAIDKQVTVDLLQGEDRNVHIVSKNFKKEVTLNVTDILDITRDAQQKWQEYRETNDITTLKSIQTDELMYPAMVIGETLMYFQQNLKEGFHLAIDSEIPLGSGLGSSAAVAASVAAAVARHLCEPTKKEVIGAIAIHAEQKKHGRPSYGDVAAVIHGGLIWFRKETENIIITHPLGFSIPPKLSQNLLLIQSGAPEESTGEMVHEAGEFRKEHPEIFAKTAEAQEQLTRDLPGVLQHADGERLIEIIRAGEKNLELIGVVSDSAKALIREIEKSGGAAKICGAGGRKAGSGIILAYHTDKQQLIALAKEKGLLQYTVQLGSKGLTIE